MLTSNGYEIKKLDEIIEDLSESIQAIFPTINLDQSTPDGQLVALVSEAISLAYDIGLNTYNELNPNTATGLALERLCNINGIVRLQASPSNVIVRFEGADGTTVPRGTGVKSDNIPNVIFYTTDAVTLTSLGYEYINCQADVNGETVVNPYDINKLQNPIVGIDTVFNEDPGSLGREVETDAQLRFRRESSVAILGGATIDALYAQVLQVDGVTDARIYENKEDFVDGNGLNPHSAWFIVRGGANQDIADAIMTKSLASGLKGQQTVQWFDSSGFGHNVHFDRPVNTEVYVYVKAAAYDGWSSAYEAEIKEKIVQYVDDVRTGEAQCSAGSFSIGDSVLASSLYPAILGSEQYRVENILVGLTYPALQQVVNLTTDGFAIFDEARVEVVGFDV